MIPEAALASFAAALFSMMNPIGNLGVFAGLTADSSGGQARRTAWACALSVTMTLVIVAWAGTQILALFGISVDALRAAGGLIILLIGLQMLFNKSEHKQSPGEMNDRGSGQSIVMVPLTIPLIAGPGTMVTVLIAAHQHSSVLSKIEITLVIACMAALTGFLFTFAAPISKRIGEAGMGAVTRVMGMVLTAIAMGMLTDGLKKMLPGLAG